MAEMKMQPESMMVMFNFLVHFFFFLSDAWNNT